MYKNIANNLSTNIFETQTGVLNIAPTKISGQYKIVVDLKNNLWLDDYTGRRTIIDKTRDFLPQVANFLKVNTFLNDTTQLKYGGFQKSTKKYWHIPLYLGTTDKFSLPKYFVLSRVVNETIDNINSIYKYGKITNVIDLEKIGLHNIFQQILKEKYFNFPVYFNWQDNNIKIYGYSIDKDIPATHTFDIVDSQANQTDLSLFNSLILNSFAKQNMFFPCFINIEFEFEYSNEDIIFNNFYGFLSFQNEIEISQLNENSFNIKLQDYIDDKIIWKQEYPNTNTVLNKYIDMFGGGSIRNISNKLPQFSLKTSRLLVDDNISIYHPNGEIEFSYTVLLSDIKTTLYESLVGICNKATIESKRKFLFSVEELSQNFCKITIILNFIDSFSDEYLVTYPNYFLVNDRFYLASNYNNFRGITDNDIWLPGQPDLLKGINEISINNVFYSILDKFQYNNQTIIRLNKPTNINQVEECKIFNNKFEKLLKLTPIQFLSFNSDLSNYLPCEQKKYVDDLITKFGENNAIKLFAKTEIEQLNQYVTEELNVVTDINNVKTSDNNTDICLSMFFNSIGQTSYITPDILNIDKRFHVQNGSLDADQLDSDILRYNWFLINGKCPDYLKNDIRSLRYFNINEKPKLTSRIIKISDELCETIFLGVKYQFPIKYANFSFATYINFNTKSDEEMHYNFVIDKNQKTIYLVVNKYLDFVDLLRGGNDTNEPLLDLSFFYLVDNSFNEESEYIGDFKTSILKLCDEFKPNDPPIYFEGIRVNDWKYFNPVNNKWYIAIRNQVSNDPEKINDLRFLFSKSTADNIFHVYSSITIDGIVYSYPSIMVNVKNIVFVDKAYLWCEDVSIKFFDTQEFFIKKFNELTQKEDIFLINKENILSYEPAGNNIFGDYEQITTIVQDATNQQFKLLLPANSISLKENYFEINQSITKDDYGTKIPEKRLFTFPECTLGLTEEEMINLFDDQLIDLSVPSNKITLFNRNQIWRVIQDLFKVDLKFKFLSKEMIRLIINKFMITNLIDFSDVNSLPITFTNENFGEPEYLKIKINSIDKNIVVWNKPTQDILILINRFRTCYLPYLPNVENEIEFQLPKYKQNNRLFNIYDKDFGGNGISATGLWQEVHGNLISSFFCQENDINITIPFENTVDYKQLLINNFININKIIITNNNREYIKKINANINEYILDIYAIYLLKTFYSFVDVTNELNQRVIYNVDQQNTYLVKFYRKTESLTFNFKRK